MPFFKELRFAARSLVRTPAFTLIAVLTLGIGIGMSMAVWTIVDAVLIGPLPYPDGDRLVTIGLTLPDLGTTGYPMSALDYLDYAERNSSFESMAAVFRENLNLTGDSLPERVQGASVSAAFFDVMKTPPQPGRAFTAEEDAPGADLVAVISHGLWHRRFAGAPDVARQNHHGQWAPSGHRRRGARGTRLPRQHRNLAADRHRSGRRGPRPRLGDPDRPSSIGRPELTTLLQILGPLTSGSNRSTPRPIRAGSSPCSRSRTGSSAMPDILFWCFWELWDAFCSSQLRTRQFC